MKTRHLSLGGLSLTVAEGWDDITATLDDPAAPWTVADPDSGVGAMQFSSAIYNSGALPKVTTHDLSDLLREFVATRGFQSPFDRVVYPGSTFAVGESFHDGSDFVRVWYCSDGKNLVLVTYVCDWSQRNTEAETREMMLRSIRFS